MHTEGGAGRPNLFSGLQAPIKTTGNQVPYQDLKDDLRRRGVGFSLDDGHLHHGHYYLVR
jgi:hypothetical protein